MLLKSVCSMTIITLDAGTDNRGYIEPEVRRISSVIDPLRMYGPAPTGLVLDAVSKHGVTGGNRRIIWSGIASRCGRLHSRTFHHAAKVAAIGDPGSTESM